MWRGHTAAVGALCELEGGLVASGSQDRTVRVWEGSSGACLRILEGFREQVTSIAMLPGGRVAAAGHDGTIRVWQFMAENPPELLERHGDRVCTVTVSLIRCQWCCAMR